MKNNSGSRRYTASPDSLSRHVNASQLRIDAWDKLKRILRRLEDRSKANQSTARLQKDVEEIFAILEPIENYWAFPGKTVMAELEDLFEERHFINLSNIVKDIVRMLVSETYRTHTAPLQASMDAQVIFKPDARRSAAHARHYFEVLLVDDLSLSEEMELRRGLLKNIDPNDQYVYDVVVVPSYEDALIAITLNHNIQSCVIPLDLSLESDFSLDALQPYLAEIDALAVEDGDHHLGPILGQTIRRLRPELDLFLIVNAGVEEIDSRAFAEFTRVFYRQENYLDLHLSIKRGIAERFQTPFFTALKDYSQRPTGVFHAMPISRGNSVFKSHWIRDMGDFYGRNIFLAETSATSGGLDSLLQPTGPLKTAQELAARAFGAQHTFFVTNGTSSANKIVMQALVQPGDIVLIDRDCHKSHHYGLVLGGGYPVYLDSYPNEDYSMYGAVPLAEIKRTLLTLKREGKLDRVKMLLLTNCTFDGLIYNVERVMEEVLAIKPDMIFLWDEAWFGFARFAPTYRQRTAMYNAQRLQKKYGSEAYREQYAAYVEPDADDEEAWINTRLMPDPDKVTIRAYATQSTHKKMSSLRQGSMIHIYDEEFQRKVEDAFHEAYMTHTSTSPNYQILASLDVARRQGELEGYELVQKSLEMAMVLRANVADNPQLRKYFRILTPSDLIRDEFRQSGIERYYDPDKGWSKFDESWRGDEFVLDPTHITLFIGETGIDGDTFKNKYLMDQFGIQINKTSRNTVLFMTNIGTTRSAIAFLISVLQKIARQLEDAEKAHNQAERELHEQQIYSLCKDLPPLPDFSAFHPHFQPYPGIPAGDIRAAYFLAYDEEKCEYMRLDGTIERAIEGGWQVVSTSFVIPYPPGFPILVPGQVISKDILTFLKALDVKEIHGYRPSIGLRVFRTQALDREDQAEDESVLEMASDDEQD